MIECGSRELWHAYVWASRVCVKLLERKCPATTPPPVHSPRFLMPSTSIHAACARVVGHHAAATAGAQRLVVQVSPSHYFIHGMTIWLRLRGLRLHSTSMHGVFSLDGPRRGLADDVRGRHAL